MAAMQSTKVIKMTIGVAGVAALCTVVGTIYQTNLSSPQDQPRAQIGAAPSGKEASSSGTTVAPKSGGTFAQPGTQTRQRTRTRHS